MRPNGMPQKSQHAVGFRCDYQPDVDLLYAWVGEPVVAENVEVEPGIYVRVSPTSRQVVGIEAVLAPRALLFVQVQDARTFGEELARQGRLEEAVRAYTRVLEKYPNSPFVSDAAAEQLAMDISKKIQTDMQYPGQIKVTVIRETRAVDYAK